jgi:hypothetical protein
MATTAAPGLAAWGAAAWGSSDEVIGSVTRTIPTGSLTLAGNAPTVLPIRTEPVAGSLALTGALPIVTSSSIAVIPVVGSLALLGVAPVAFQSAALRPPVGTLVLIGLAPELEHSDENMLGFQWAVLMPADLPLGFKWTVLPVTIAGGELGFTWVVIQASPSLGFTWHVVPAEIFELFESDGVGAAAGIGEDVLLPVGRVTRE